MNYQVLARKWRPQRFSQVVGQEHVLTALANGLDSNRLHHAYLFSGTRGVGKTSIARLFAKGLNCERGVTSDPCGTCDNCRAIEEGRFIDLLEIDAASRTKVEDTRELLDNVQYKPVQGRYKIYLIDEVHMLSRHSFNALLKTLEEPPEYVKFLLATTDPHKLPITILSRCIQFHLKALEAHQIAAHLEYILQQEKISYQFSALEQLAKAAKGSIRDALSLTDQAIAMSNSCVSREIVHQMLGTLDSEQALDIIQALQLADGDSLMRSVQQVASKGVEWDQLLQDIAANLHQIAMRQLLNSGENNSERIDFLARNLPPEDIQFYYQLILDGRKELPFAPDQRSGVEMTLLRALAFHPKLLQWDKHHPVDSVIAPRTAAEKAQQQSESTQQNLQRIREQLPKTDNTPLQPKPSIIPDSISRVDEQQAVISGDETLTAPPTSPALQALQARNQLKNQQKKNTNLDLTSVSSAVSAELLGEDISNSTLPQPADRQSCGKSLELMERLNRISNGRTTSPSSSMDKKAIHHQPQTTPCVADHEAEALTCEEDTIGEDYHWQWLNPELESDDSHRLRPSDIKQAILQERTPELIAKVLKLSAERDPWSNILEQLDLDGMVKQLGLNALLLQQDGEQVKLGLRSQQSNLNNPRYINILQQKLTQFYQCEVRLEVRLEDDSSRLTPLEQRRQIYQELSEQARQDLQQDPQLIRLQQEFAAELDLNSIRPVG